MIQKLYPGSNRDAKKWWRNEFNAFCTPFQFHICVSLFSFLQSELVYLQHYRFDPGRDLLPLPNKIYSTYTNILDMCNTTTHTHTLHTKTTHTYSTRTYVYRLHYRFTTHKLNIHLKFHERSTHEFHLECSFTSFDGGHVSS